MAFVPSPLADMTLPQNSSAPVTVVQSPSGAITVTQTGGPATAAQMLDAAKAYREALSDQYDRLRNTRSNLASATREDNRTATDIAGLEVG